MALAGKDVSPDKKTGFTYQGREIVLSKTRGRPLVNQHWKKGYYTDKQRIEAVTLYAATGSARKVNELTGIPVDTLRKWRKQPWFLDLLDEIRAENDDVIDQKFNEIIVSALDQLQDRVVNGDHVLTKDGELVRKPVVARDLSIVTAINIDKRQLLRGKPTSRSEQVTNQSIDERLRVLADNFTALSGKKLRKPETVDAEIIEIKEEDHGRKQSFEGKDDVQPIDGEVGGDNRQETAVSETEREAV